MTLGAKRVLEVSGPTSTSFFLESFVFFVFVECNVFLVLRIFFLVSLVAEEFILLSILKSDPLLCLLFVDKSEFRSYFCPNSV